MAVFQFFIPSEMMKLPMRDEQLTSVPKGEENIYGDVYDVLLGGMLVSCALFAVGVVLALIHPRYVPLTRAYVLRDYHVGTLIHGLGSGSPSAYLMLATALLILTPISRVVISVYAFHKDNDRKYTVVTGIVLFVIVLTALLGKLGLR
jgi:uncharacterized membrane protein